MPSSQILPQLFVGNEYAASAPDVHAFRHVLNITIEVAQSSLLAEGVCFQRFPIFDFGGDKQQQAMFGFFVHACCLIERGLASGQRVLVHCVEGKQRSCAVVAAYLIAALGLTASQATALILEKRPEAFDSGAHVNFAPALERWEMSQASTTALRSRGSTTTSATGGQVIQENPSPAVRGCSGSKAVRKTKSKHTFEAPKTAVPCRC